MDVFFTEAAEEWILGLAEDNYEAMMAAIELLGNTAPRWAGRPSIASAARAITT